MPISRAVCVILAVGAISACGVDKTVAPLAKARFRNTCTAYVTSGVQPSFPDPSGCDTAAIGYQPTEMQFNYATVEGDAYGWEPVWSGEEFDTFDASYDLPSCPRTVVNPTFKVYIMEYGVDAEFTVPGVVEKFSDDGTSVYGLPMATYLLPPNMAIVSKDGRFVAQGGFIRARCLNLDVRTRVGVRVTGGFNVYFDTDTHIYRNPGYQSGGGRGWGWHDASTGWSNGAGDGWAGAIDYYERSGQCLVGWEIYVDGVQVCDAYGVAQT